MGFNPRTPAGCDATHSRKQISIWVSIHAPLRGATLEPTGSFFWYSVSIHAPLRGATQKIAEVARADLSFNPRTPAGCDRGCYEVRGNSIRFQSTHPCGVRRTTKAGKPKLFQAVSIHAPLRGATMIPKTYLIDIVVSIHAPLRGATVG